MRMDPQVDCVVGMQQLWQTPAKLSQINAPAFVIDYRGLEEAAKAVRQIAPPGDINVLFSTKALDLACVIERLSPSVDGFAVSSLFEAQLVRDTVGRGTPIHMTTPGIREDEIDSLVEVCDYLSLNSLSQLERFSGAALGRISLGVRVNPEVSFISDSRYDPCRMNSKLGVPLSKMEDLVHRKPTLFDSITGIHVHGNCDSTDLNGVLHTVHILAARLDPLLRHVKWVNLGGGYMFDEILHIQPFGEAASLLRNKYGVKVFIEPGAAFVRRAAYFVTSVLDIFVSHGKRVAILDTTVNHWPEIFEYEYEPDVVGHIESGCYEYILAGCSCLAGDVFGEYAFEQRLEIGSRVLFANAGAYSFVKAHMFNGINLPTIYAMTEKGELMLIRRFTYDDFASRCGVRSNATA